MLGDHPCNHKRGEGGQKTQNLDYVIHGWSLANLCVLCFTKLYWAVFIEPFFVWERYTFWCILTSKLSFKIHYKTSLSTHMSLGCLDKKGLVTVIFKIIFDCKLDSKRFFSHLSISIIMDFTFHFLIGFYLYFLFFYCISFYSFL